MESPTLYHVSTAGTLHTRVLSRLYLGILSRKSHAHWNEHAFYRRDQWLPRETSGNTPAAPFDMVGSLAHSGHIHVDCLSSVRCLWIRCMDVPTRRGVFGNHFLSERVGESYAPGTSKPVWIRLGTFLRISMGPLGGPSGLYAQSLVFGSPGWHSKRDARILRSFGHPLRQQLLLDALGILSHVAKTGGTRWFCCNHNTRTTIAGRIFPIGFWFFPAHSKDTLRSKGESCVNLWEKFPILELWRQNNEAFWR